MFPVELTAGFEFGRKALGITVYATNAGDTACGMSVKFTALGQVRLSFALSFFRKLVYFVALFALPALLGARAAFYAEPVSDVIGPAVSVCVHRVMMDRVLSRRLEQR